MLSTDVHARNQFQLASPLEHGMSGATRSSFLVTDFTLDVSPVLLLACYQLLWNVEREGLCVTAEVLLQWNVFNFAYEKFEGLVFLAFFKYLG